MKQKRCTLKIIFRLMTSRKALIIERYSILILFDETKYQIFCNEFENTYVHHYITCWQSDGRSRAAPTES